MFGAFFSILFELGIPNLVFVCILGWQSVMYLFCDLDLISTIIVSGCILGWQSVMYQFCDLDLISTIIVSGAYLIYFLREEFQICCMDTRMDTSLDADVSHTILDHCDFEL